MGKFFELFNLYKPANEKSRILNTALICDMQISDDGRSVKLDVQFTDIIHKTTLLEVVSELKDLYGFETLTINAKYPKELFSADYFSDMTEYCRESEPLCNGFFAGADVQYENETFKITLHHGGCEILKLKGADRLMERLVNDEFGINLHIELIEGEPAPKKAEPEEKVMPKIKQPIKKEASKKEAPGQVLYGGGQARKEVKISEIMPDTGAASVVGKIINMDKHVTKQGNWVIFTFGITDKTSSIKCKLFLNVEQSNNLEEKLNEHSYVKISGDIIYDKYDHELQLAPKTIWAAVEPKRMDNAEQKRIELHLHTKMSQMDAVTDVADYIKTAMAWGHEAIAITDHGVLQSFPTAFLTAEKIKYPGKIIYGVEDYFVNDTTPSVFGKTDEPFDGTYVVFDLETTGLSAETEYITEIGAVKIKNGEVADKLDTFAKPEKPIPQKITELTGITNEMVAGAPSQKDAVQMFLDFCGDSVLVAHNAQFDTSFIRAAVRRFELKFDNAYIDTVALARRLYPELKNHKLDTVAEAVGAGNFNHHRACDDAEVLSRIFVTMCEKMKKDFNITGSDQINTGITGTVDVKKVRTNHQIILVRNRVGLKNLFKLVTKSNLVYFRKTPRIPKSELVQYREGLLVGSACEAGELYQAILDGRPEEDIRSIAAFYDFLEIQPLANNLFLIENGKVKDVEELKNINRKIVKLGEKLKKPVVATCDVHFLNPEDEIFRKILLHIQKFSDADKPMPLYMRTTEEMLKEFSYLGEEEAFRVVVENPKKIADMCEKIRPLPPEGKLFKPELPGVEEDIKRLSYDRARVLYGDPLPPVVQERLNRELDSIIKHGYAVIYMIAQKLVSKSISDGYLVGSRGSVGSSLVANMAGITEVNSLVPHYICPNCKHYEFDDSGDYECGVDMPDRMCPVCGTKYRKDGHSIPFETFLGFDGDKVPDIDLNFSGDYQPRIHKYTEEILGKDNVFRAGTVGTVADKTAYGFVKNYTEAKGITLPETEMVRLASGCEGVKRTTGQHPGGLMVVPDSMDIEDFTPVQHPADDDGKDIITTHFEYKYIHDNLLKLDLLGHDDPTVIRMLSDLTGIDARSIPLDDKKTMSLFSSTEALGIEPDEIISTVGTIAIPEFGTRFVRGMLEETRPTTFGELIRISGLSHGTDVWLGNASDLIEAKTATLKEVFCTRDDIMNSLIHKGLPKKLAFTIMESVRKGKGLKPEWEEEMKANNVPSWYIDSCHKIKYMFPRAHAVAYVTMAYRIAWFKINFPLAFYATYFTVRADDFNAETMVFGLEKVQSRLEELSKLDKITAKEKNEQTILEVCYEFYKRGLNFDKIDIYSSDPSHFQISGKDSLRPPFNAISGLGISAAESVVREREKEPFLSCEDLLNRTNLSKTIIETMRSMGLLDIIPETTQITLF
ncbi:MAG: PolC-type DNA polymerase III [Bacillota bacterium]|nr:PolC-type DNA polymerase III [Bacillota bacterium]